MFHNLELVALSDHEWKVCDCTEGLETIGFVDNHDGVFDALLLDTPLWRPHFGSLESATHYFEEYLDALELGVSS